MLTEAEKIIVREWERDTKMRIHNVRIRHGKAEWFACLLEAHAPYNGKVRMVLSGDNGVGREDALRRALVASKEDFAHSIHTRTDWNSR